MAADGPLQDQSSSHEANKFKQSSSILNLNPSHLDIKTRTVEKTLEPLVLQVTTLVSSTSHAHKSPKKNVNSERAHVLVAAVEKATANFAERGNQIAQENPEIKHDMLLAVKDVLATGNQMSMAAREFANDPCCSIKRGNMVVASRGLLSAVTRLLILADMIDVHLLLGKLHKVEDDLENLRSVNSQTELNESMQRFGINSKDLISQAAKRQQELMDPIMRDDLAAARAVLKKHSLMLMTASKAYVRHPELAAAKANRDYVLNQVSGAVSTISDVAKGTQPKGSQSSFEGPGELAAALDEFDASLIMNPMTYDDVENRKLLEESLESIISGASLLADSSFTRNEHRDQILSAGNSVRIALQDLLTEYMENRGKVPTENLDVAIDMMCKKTKDMRRQLHRAVVDHISDSFLMPETPIMLLTTVASEGKDREVEEMVVVFNDHATKITEVAKLSCFMSNNCEGVKMVRFAASQTENLCPQVVNAARVLAARPKSRVAQENMNVFKDAWMNQVRILTDAVDDITTIEDFLTVSEHHILSDVRDCIATFQKGDANGISGIANLIRGRCFRVCQVVTSEMENYEPGTYINRVLEAVQLLGNDVVPNFMNKSNIACSNIREKKPLDEDEFINSARLVYVGVHEIRQAVFLKLGSTEDLDSTDSLAQVPDLEIKPSPSHQVKESPKSSTSDFDEYPDISGISNAQEAMKKLPEEDRAKIEMQVEVFRVEKRKFDIELSKWDDTGNEIIVLAKHMCTIMMEMTDFTRGCGPLQTTMAVINAARRISEAGTKLDKLANQIADQCPESSTKADLLAYLQRIALYCHQLNITSKVKADVQNVSGELVISGLDSATSLIQAAKNLMNAVVLTVKASYVASTKYPRQAVASVNNSKPVVVWKMKVPEKKPLVRHDPPDELYSKVHKGSQPITTNPFQLLNEFLGTQETT